MAYFFIYRFGNSRIIVHGWFTAKELGNICLVDDDDDSEIERAKFDLVGNFSKKFPDGKIYVFQGKSPHFV